MSVRFLTILKNFPIVRGLASLILAGLILVGFPTHLWADEVVCPPTIDVAQEIKNTPPDWEAFTDTVSLRFVNVSFSSGTPDKQMVLAPTSSTKRGSDLINVWEFFPSDQEDTWVSCLYNNTTIMLSRKLPKDARQCRVTYDGRHRGPVAKKIECK